MKYDLHVHSNVSDGKLTRKEIIKMAINSKLEYIAFIEHNNFLPNFDNSSKIKYINGIEFDVMFQRSFHLLCYFPEFNNTINSLILKFRENTNDCSDLLIKKIKEIYNIDFSLDELKRFTNKESITKRDIIDWLLYNNYAKSVEEAANTYTNKNALSYVPKYSLEFQEVSDVIKNSGGFIFLAHPVSLHYSDYDLEKFIFSLKTRGLDGMEIINTSKMTSLDTLHYRSLAKKWELLTSGGSDFHDDRKNVLGIAGNDSDVLIKKLSK